jgi:hypothetical protein
MLDLVRKDFLVSRWLWMASSVLYVLYLVQQLGLGSSALLLAFAAMLLIANLIIPLFFEDKDKTETLFASLPLRRVDLVRGRYLLAGLLLAANGALIFGTGAAVKVLFPAQASHDTLVPLLSFEGVAGYVLGGGFLLAAYLPMYCRWGLGRSLMVFYPSLVALLAAAAGLERLASGPWGLIPPLFTPDFLKDPGRAVIAGIGVIRAAMGTPLFLATVAACFTVLAFVSFRLSTRFYERREF